VKGCELVSNLDNLTAKILADAREKAGGIAEEAKREAEAKIAEEVRAAEEEAARLVADSELEAARIAEQLIQGKTLSVRDENLAAKREMLDKVFAEALKRLNDMEKPEFEKFLAGYLSKLELSGEELTLPAKYAITAVPFTGVSVVADSKRNIEGGFILSKNGIEQNHTFEALLRYYRDDLEPDVLKILYAE
jgi:V/A-type H+-transporting ATPase subunit E